MSLWTILVVDLVLNWPLLQLNAQGMKTIKILLSWPWLYIHTWTPSSMWCCLPLRDIYRVVSLLLKNDLPHNLVMLRAPPFSRGQQQQQLQSTTTASQTADDDDGATVIRTILVPRKPAYGIYYNSLVVRKKNCQPWLNFICKVILYIESSHILS